MNQRQTISFLCGASALMLLLACGGGGSTPPPTPAAASLAYTDPTSGAFQLKKNATLSTSTKLVLDLVAVNAGNGAGAAFHLTADTTRVNWAKVQDADPEYVRNGTVFTLGTAPQAFKGKVSGNVLQVVVSQKGLAGSPVLNGTLATVALSLRSGIAPGAVTLDAVAGKAQILMASGATDTLTINKGTLTAQ